MAKLSKWQKHISILSLEDLLTEVETLILDNPKNINKSALDKLFIKYNVDFSSEQNIDLYPINGDKGSVKEYAQRVCNWYYQLCQSYEMTNDWYGDIIFDKHFLEAIPYINKFANSHDNTLSKVRKILEEGFFSSEKVKEYYAHKDENNEFKFVPPLRHGIESKKENRNQYAYKSPTQYIDESDIENIMSILERCIHWHCFEYADLHINLQGINVSPTNNARGQNEFMKSFNDKRQQSLFIPLYLAGLDISSISHIIGGVDIL